MDVLILITMFGGFIVFFVTHLVIFSRSKTQNVIGNLFRSYLMSGSIQLIISFWVGGGLVYLLLSFVLYSLLTFSYILAIFGITVTSMRINMLLEIGAGGIKREELKRIYTPDTIISTRLTRLVDGGELYNHGVYYYPRFGWSYFLIHTYALVILNRLYHLSGYRKFSLSHHDQNMSEKRK